MAALLAAGLGACSSVDSAAKKKAASDAQADPTLFPKEYKTEVAEFMRTYLNNPTKVKDAYIGEPALRQVGNISQYITCVRYNPRDINDVYQGTQINVAIFLGGQVAQFLAGDPKFCNGLNYVRYPEIESMVP